ncbi:MAG: biopolymer transporter ExbD [Lentisphaerae bacterium]|jgi:biopolymer transport protein ExbD|nr:biopolymer transporter ExbD [Lentisphaerota bacterium]
MRRRRNRAQMVAIDQINVTPLLDLTFLLLIAFMITMPLMEYGTNVSEPPEMNSEKLPDENFVCVSLTKDGTIMLDKDAISRADLEKKLQELSAKKPRPQLLLRGDGSRSYKDVIELLALIRAQGFSDATLVTQAESNN